MKNKLFLVLTISFLWACNTKHDYKRFDGFWRLNTICPNGEIIEGNSIFRILNDTLFTLQPDNIDIDYCVLNSTEDSITIYDECGIYRQRYKFHSNQKRFDFDDKIQFVQLDSSELKTQHFFDQVRLKINLPYMDSDLRFRFLNPRLIYLGKELKILNENCSEKLDSEQSQNVRRTAYVNKRSFYPLILEDSVVLKYRDTFIFPNNTKDLKTELLSTISPTDTISLILCADKFISDSTIFNIIKEFSDQRITTYQMGISKDNHLDFRYKKTVANN